MNMTKKTEREHTKEKQEGNLFIRVFVCFNPVIFSAGRGKDTVIY